MSSSLPRIFCSAVIIEALGESFEFVERYGIDAPTFFSISSTARRSSLRWSPLTGHGLQDRQFEPAGFQLALGAKDIGLVSRRSGAAARVEMPVAKLLHDRFLEAMAEGFGELDWSAVGSRAGTR